MHRYQKFNRDTFAQKLDRLEHHQHRPGHSCNDCLGRCAAGQPRSKLVFVGVLNMQQSRKYPHELSNAFRCRLWYEWIDGRKVRRTEKSVEDLADWKDQAKG